MNPDFCVAMCQQNFGTRYKTRFGGVEMGPITAKFGSDQQNFVGQELKRTSNGIQARLLLIHFQFPRRLTTLSFVDSSIVLLSGESVET